MLNLFKKISSAGNENDPSQEDDEVNDPPEVPTRRQIDTTQCEPDVATEPRSTGQELVALTTATAQERLFSFGNPSIETISGRIEIDKETVTTRLAVVDVPTHETLVDFCEFVTQHSQSLSQAVTHIQIFGQTCPDKSSETSETVVEDETSSATFYLILLNFSVIEQAREFLRLFDGRRYNSIESDECHVFYLYSAWVLDRKVSRVTDKNDSDDEVTQLPLASQLVRVRSNRLGDQTQFMFPPAKGTGKPNDIPKCVICQEYVEEPDNFDGSAPVTPMMRGISTTSETEIFSALTPPPQQFRGEDLWSKTAIIIVLCNHLFHVPCLLGWRDNSCPICRHNICPEELPSCDDCGVMTEDVWQCLVCGHLGCDRESNEHALRHFEETQHTYAKHIRTDRVWDYAQNEFVYRLIQNKSDGKYVALMGGDGDEDDAAVNTSKEHYRQLQEWAMNKQTQMMNELDYVLTQQLEVQKQTYVDQMRLAQENEAKLLEKLRREREQLERELEERRRKLREHDGAKRSPNDFEAVDSKQPDLGDEESDDCLVTAQNQYSGELKTREKLKIMCHNLRKEIGKFNKTKMDLTKELNEEIQGLQQVHQTQILQKKNELRDYSSHLRTVDEVNDHFDENDMASASVSVAPGKSKNNAKRNKKTKGSRRGRGRRR